MIAGILRRNSVVPRKLPMLAHLVLTAALAAPPADDEHFALHFQATVATQAHPSFDAPYSGKNSLQPGAVAF